MKKKNSIYAVILVGGSGTRFWPLSRPKKPKQFLQVVGKTSLFRQSLERLKGLVADDQIILVTNKQYGDEIRRQIKGFCIPKQNILMEPQGRNTAPAICWAASIISKRDSSAVMVVLPSDHLITQRRCFQSVIKKAVGLAGENYLVTLGIVPHRPETGYGYLKLAHKPIDGHEAFEVDRFVEKPSLPRAKQYVRTKRYLWNSGMFVWSCGTILEAFDQFLPDVAGVFKRLDVTERTFRRKWMGLPNISIDYGILEKADRVAAVAAGDIGWSDVGSWESLDEVLPKDKDGNYGYGDVLTVDTENTFVWSTKKPVALIGLKDVIVVDTPDGLLVCRKDLSQNVRHAAKRYMKK